MIGYSSNLGDSTISAPINSEIKNQNEIEFDTGISLPTWGSTKIKDEEIPKIVEVQTKKICDAMFTDEINNMIRINCREQELVRFI
jgi:hypothetical protein